MARAWTSTAFTSYLWILRVSLSTEPSLHSLPVGVALYFAPKNNCPGIPAGVYIGDHCLMIAFPGPFPAPSRRNSHLPAQFLPPAPSTFSHQRRVSGYASWWGGLEATSIHPVTSPPRRPPTEIVLLPVLLQATHIHFSWWLQNMISRKMCSLLSKIMLPSFLHTAPSAERPNPVPICKGLGAGSLTLPR